MRSTLTPRPPHSFFPEIGWAGNSLQSPKALQQILRPSRVWHHALERAQQSLARAPCAVPTADETRAHDRQTRTRHAFPLVSVDRNRSLTKTTHVPANENERLREHRSREGGDRFRPQGHN